MGNKEALQILEGILFKGTITDVRRFCVAEIKKDQESGQPAGNLFYRFQDTLETLYSRKDITWDQLMEVRAAMLKLFD